MTLMSPRPKSSKAAADAEIGKKSRNKAKGFSNRTDNLASKLVPVFLDIMNNGSSINE